MKYPYTIFFRNEEYSYIDNFLINNNEDLDCSIFITSDINDINKLFDTNYQVLITFGKNMDEYYNIISDIPKRIKYRYIHLSEIETIHELNVVVNNCFINNCVYNREITRPIFSVFTPCYNSYHKIKRAYESLKKQTLKDWEFIVMDDSPTDDHFNFLRELMQNDSRVRLYRKSENNGNIGNLKNETVSLCRGKYVLEFDHDDEILPFVLQESADYFDKNSDVGFIYMDFILLYEDGSNHSYGDFICKGYGGYYCQKYNNKWVNVYNTPNINNITLSHLTCCPNHPRIWRKSSLLDAGNYSEFLPICDDYEIILKTALTTKIAKIHKFGYIQYMNDNGNNFSSIRNSEINRIGPKYIYPIYYNTLGINERMKELGAHEDEKYISNHSKIWERDDSYQHKYINNIINIDYNMQYCILGLDSLVFNIDKIKKLYEDENNDFIILENKSSLEYLQNKLDSLGFENMKCYSLINSSKKELTNYFKMLYNSVKKYEIIDVDNVN
jgi:glycosyltransferase involved in cell wall biosynthesis